MKSKHDIGCEARNNKSCNCKQGHDRKILKYAKETLKRRKSEIIKGTLNEPGNWLERRVKK